MGARGARVVIAAVLTIFALLLAATLFPTVAERGILAAVGFLVGLWVPWPKTDPEVRPMMVVGVLVAGAIGAVVMPLLVNDTLPKLFRGDIQGAAVSLIAPLAVWLIARWVRNRLSSGL